MDPDHCSMSYHSIIKDSVSINEWKDNRMWAAPSRRYFLRKGTSVRPMRLDSSEMLLECAA